MTLREEVVKYSGEELLSEEVLEEMADWVVPLVQGGKELLGWAANNAAVPLLAGSGLLLGGIVNALLHQKKQGIRALRYAKIKEADKEQIEKAVNSDMSEAAKKSLIYRILGKYATKAENAVNRVKDAVGRVKDAVGKTRIGINHKLAKEARKEQKNAIEYNRDKKAYQNYLNKYFHGSEEEYKAFQEHQKKKEALGL